jgi:Holliday junction resolvase RusA-like endonuclease
MLPFEFIVEGPPVSQQARRRERVRQWRDEVRRIAEQHWPPAELPALGRIMLTIMYFYESEPSMDIDNIPKPISDALKGLVYLDDQQVTDVLCRKRNLNSNLRIESLSGVLAEGLSRGSQFLYILVEEAPNQEVIS